MGQESLKYDFLHHGKIPCDLFTKNERALGKLRMKYFDSKIVSNKEKTFEDLKQYNKDFQFSENLYYKSNKLILSDQKKYSSKYDWLNNREYKTENHTIVDDPAFWQDQDYFRIYEKNV